MGAPHAPYHPLQKTFLSPFMPVLYSLLLVPVEVFELVSQVVEGLLVSLAEAGLSGLLLHSQQLQIFLQLDDLLLPTAGDLTLQGRGGSG